MRGRVSEGLYHRREIQMPDQMKREGWTVRTPDDRTGSRQSDSRTALGGGLG